MSMQMYKLEVIEHFDDWYVFSDTIGEYNTINEAISFFLNERGNIIEMKRSTDGIDEYISETFGDDWDGNDANKYNIGFILKIYNNDEEEIVSQCFEYDTVSNSFESDSAFELNEDELTMDEVNILTACLIHH